MLTIIVVIAWIVPIRIIIAVIMIIIIMTRFLIVITIASASIWLLSTIIDITRT